MNVIPQRLARAWARLGESLPRSAQFLSTRLLTTLIAAGFVVRLGGAFLYGTGDMEWWKAWGSYAVEQSLTGLYGAPDGEIIQRWQEGGSLDEIRGATQTVIPYQAHDYFRTEYRMVQPPVYAYSLHLSTTLYRIFSPELANNRAFNFFLNLQPIASSAVLALVIAWFVSLWAGRGTGQLAGLIYWLNPLVILNAPIQAFQDPLCALFAVLSVVMLYQRRSTWAFVFLALSFMTKPQGVLIAPVVVWVGLCEERMGKNVLAWGAAVVTCVVVSLPFIISHHFLSMVLGVLSITESSGDLSRQSMNLWWPVQYGANAVRLVSEEGVGIFSAVAGADRGIYEDFPIRDLTAVTHINATGVGLTLLAAFTVLNLWYVRRGLRFDRNAIAIAAGLQVYGYFILRAGVQNNHYFILIPIMTLVACISSASLKHYLAICSIFLLQDLIFYGFGRDANYGKAGLSMLHLAWTTNLLALANVGLFLYLCRYHFSILKEPLRDLRRHTLSFAGRLRRPSGEP